MLFDAVIPQRSTTQDFNMTQPSDPGTSRSHQIVVGSTMLHSTNFQSHHQDATMFTTRWKTCSFDDDAADSAYIDDSFTEWVYQPDELEHLYDTEDDVPDSMVASSSSTSASVFWSYSGVASTASTSVDSLGLHHVSLGSGSDSPPGPVYDKTNFATTSDSIWTQHELSELDITSVPPSSGALVNWNSPSTSCCTMDEDDDIGRLLGQKRPRDLELDELVERYKRRRTLPELCVQG